MDLLKLQAAHPTLLRRLHHVLKELPHLLAPNHIHATRQKNLHIVRKLGHQPVPVALVQRIQMLIHHRSRIRLLLHRWQLHLRRFLRLQQMHGAQRSQQEYGTQSHNVADDIALTRKRL